MLRGSTREVPTFSDIEADLGYNPARFLQTQSSDGHTSIGDTSELAMAQAVIRGIDDIETIRAWIEVEVELGCGQNGGPRQHVIKQLHQQQRQIKGNADNASPPAEGDGEAQSPTGEVENATVGAETVSNDGTAESATQPDTSSVDMTTSAVATDGGTEPPPDPTCSNCGGDLKPEKIAGRLGYWCANESDFREPVAASDTVEGQI